MKSQIAVCFAKVLASKQKHPQGKPAVFAQRQVAIVEQLSSIVPASIAARKQLGQLFYK